jgi:uncharacterized protein
MPARREALSLAEARRAALAAQGFARERIAEGRALARLLGHVGLLQIDSVNVLVRSHFLPGFSRLGPYDRSLLERAAYRAPRRLFEFWGHEASLLPVGLQPLLRWRMARAADEAWGGMRRVARERPELLDLLLDEVRARGPLSAGELEAAVGRPTARKGPWWDWSDVKRGIEFLFWSGAVTTHSRRGFERRYDLPERVLPREVVQAPTPAPADAIRALVERAARCCGVATEPHLRDYFRLPVAETRRAVAELVEAGVLLPVAVEGRRGRWWLHHEARVPRRVEARALLSPFDSLVWERGRTEALFGFRFRLEIYVPAAQRVHGYYVLPFLLGDRLAGRVDLKADRAAGALLVQASWGEPEAAEALAAELRLLAGWLGLERVEVRPRGDLARPLGAASAG